MKAGDGLKDRYRKEIIRILSKNPRVERIVLFGSRAMGTFTPESDIDIVLYGDDLSLTDLAQLKQALEETTIPQKVDLLLAKDIEKKELLEHIKKYGVEWWRRGNSKEWNEIKIEKFAKVKGGKRLPKGKNLTEQKNSHPYIRVVDIRDGRISSSNLKYVPDDVFPSIKNYTVNENDIIISIVGTIGLVAKVPFSLDKANLTENAAKILVHDYTTIIPDYLYWFLKSSFGQQEIKKNIVGSTQLKLPLYGIKNITVRYPSLPEQRAIAHILGTLDDKIELNREMNTTLEEMAQAIFKSWFVDFDPVVWKAVKAGKTVPEKFSKRATYYKESGKCPVPEEILALFPDSFQDSKLGPIPKGWSVKTFPEVIEVNPKRKLRKGQIAPYLEMKNLPENSARVLGWDYRKFSSGVKFKNGDTLMARITPCLENGKGAFVDFLKDGQTGWGSTEYIVLRAKKPLPLEYAYFLSRTKEFRSHAIVNMTGSSGRQRVPASIFNSYRIIKPNDKVGEYFGKIARSIMEKMKINDAASSLLSSLRDTLLPKLISGELRVPDVEKFLKEAGL